MLYVMKKPCFIFYVLRYTSIFIIGCLSVYLHPNDDTHLHHHPTFNLSKNISRVALLIGKNLNLLVLVVIWAYTNTMAFRAVELVGAPTYSVVMQSKIFFTAGFGVLMLSRKYSFTKWRALVLLVIGCILVSSPILLPKVEAPAALPCTIASNSVTPLTNNTLGHGVTRMLRGERKQISEPASHHQLTSDQNIIRFLTETKSANISNTNTNTNSSETRSVSALDALFGLAITLSISVCSGFTSVYFERILKNGSGHSQCVVSSPTAIWDRNFQLAFYSIVFTTLVSILQSVLKEDEATMDGKQVPMFAGWSWITVLICFINSLGGFLVAATLKYADSIMKCFATSVSIILTSIIGYFFLGSEINFFSAIGMLTTILSVMNYSLIDVES
jgi:solute carrier family 35 (UDP-sugar transporter), member A1/2/3